VRSAFALTGLSQYLDQVGISNHQILDEEQWSWLHNQLSTSRASVNILVSSVQVLTTNPTVESWGHYPSERKRLLSMIHEVRPKGFAILSGDVHIGIMSSIHSKSPTIEFTSSGLTHTCTAGGIPEEVCSLVWTVFERKDRRKNMILSRNYGEITINWETREMTIGIHSMTDNNSVTAVRKLDIFPEFDVDNVDGIIPEYNFVLLLVSAFTGYALIYFVCRRIMLCFNR